MGEHLLRELAEDAGEPLPAGVVEAVLDRAARRRRHRAALAATVAVTAALTIGVALALPSLTASDAGHRTASGAGSLGPTTSVATAGGSVRPSTAVVPRGVAPDASGRGAGAGVEAQVFAAALRHVLTDPASGTPTRALSVRTSTCRSAEDGAGGPCEGTEIPSSVRVQVIRLLGPAVQITWTAGDRVGGTLVTFGPLARSAGTVTLWVEQQCGFDCLRGDRLRLVERAGTWRVAASDSVYLS